MKKILIALLTFLLGVYAFNLFNLRKAVSMPEPIVPTRKVVEISKPAFEYQPNKKPVISAELRHTNGSPKIKQIKGINTE